MISRRRKRLILLSALAIVLVAVVGWWSVLNDGRDGTSPSNTPHETPADLTGRVITSTIWKPRRNPPGAPACTRGQVAIDANGLLHFQAKCKTYGDEDAYFTVAAYPNVAERSHRPIFGGEKIGLSVSGGGAGARGSCTVNATESQCVVHTTGAFVAKGSLSVGPEHRCEGGVSMSVVDPAPCSGDLCAGPLTLRFLALGRPEGC